MADLQTLAATASGYYPDHGLSGAGYYQNGNGQGPYHNAPSAAQGSAYGPVYYQVNQGASLSNDYEVRKRAAFDALNEFFGDAKRRYIDPTTYYDVGHRLMSLQGVQLPMLGTVGGGYSGSDTYSGGATAAPIPHQHYTLPLPNLRTKNDLLNIEQFLDQLQTTVYENSQQAAAAGVHQAGAHFVHPGVNYGRTSTSPPSVGQAASSHASNLSSSHINALAPIATPATETPALTPASSVMSYTSNAGGSPPNSHHSGSSISPSRVPTSSIGGSMYPTLPAVSAMGDLNTSSYSTSGAPASSLASGFDSDGRRRYSGGLLQRAAPERPSYSDRMEEDTPTQSPKALHSHDGSRSSSSAADEERGRQLNHDIRKMNIMSPSMIDPAMRSPGDKSDERETGTPNRDDGDKTEAWVENMRMIEMLKDFVTNRLKNGEYEEEDVAEGAGKDDHPDKMDEDIKTEAERDAESLYPVLRAVQDT